MSTRVRGSTLAAVFAILAMTIASFALGGISNEQEQETASSSNGTEIVAVWRVGGEGGSGLSAPVMTSTIRFVTAQKSVVTTTGRYHDREDGGTASRQVINGGSHQYDIIDNEGHIQDRRVSISDESPIEDAELSDGAFLMQFANASFPTVDMTRVLQLEASDVITQSDTDTMFGREIKVYEFPDTFIAPTWPMGWMYRVNVAVTDAVKLGTITDSGPQGTSVWDIVSADFSASLDESDFDIDRTLDSIGSIVETRVVVGDEPDLPDGMEYSLIPITATISASTTIGAATLVSETYRNSGTPSNQSLWRLESRIYRNDLDAGLIIQAPIEQRLFNPLSKPSEMMNYWPAYWQSNDATESPNGWFELRETRTISGSIVTDAYTLADSEETPSGELVPRYRHEITWIEGDALRIIALDNGEFTGLSEFVEFVSAFREQSLE
ncbi:MAG: hypothetical protein ABI604_18670 [Nitrospirota bacterium]